MSFTGALATFSDAQLVLGKKTIFDGLNLQIQAGERIGLIGPNGSGKSSLLRVLAGEYALDHGNLSLAKGMRLGYLRQDIEIDDDGTLLGFVRKSVPGRQALETRLHTVEKDLAQGGESEDHLMELSAELAELHERLAHFDTHYADHNAHQILAGLGFSATDHERPLKEFSGGWKMRAVLAALLFMQPDFLLMDEPTNHLDMPSVAWFSNFLKSYPRTFILISHDREFLNEQISRVISLEPEGIRTYQGNYESYLVQRAEEERVLRNRHANLAKEREQAEAFIQRFRAQANKAKAVQSRIKALEKMEEVQLLDTHDEVGFRFPKTAQTSKEVLRTEALAKSYGSLRVFDGVDLSVLRGEKIAVMGVNGAGKTTLLKVLAEEIGHDAGEIRLGSHVRLGFYAQHHAEGLELSHSVLQEVSYAAQGQSPTLVRSLLGSLLFRGDDVEKPISVLSGGERARVALAKILLSPVNLLLMDEPTNHLDLRSSERLAEALQSYDGTLIFVSHNRAFIRALATRIWNVAEGRVETYPGTLDEYMESSTRTLDLAVGHALMPVANDNGQTAGHQGTNDDAGADASKESKKERKRREAQARQRRAKVLGPLEKEIAALEKDIESLETEQAERSAQLSDPDIYGDPRRSNDILSDFQRDSARLEALHGRWEEAELEREAALARLAEEEGQPG